MEYVFYEDRLTAKTEAGNSEVPYDKLYQVMETNTNFYLLVGANQSFAVKKADCTKELLARLQRLHQARGAERDNFHAHKRESEKKRKVSYTALATL